MGNYERVKERAIEVIGDDEKAQEWLEKQSRTLGDAPISLLETDEGADRVMYHLATISRNSIYDL